MSIPILCAANLAMISPANTYPGLTKNIPGAVESNEPDVYYPNCKRNYTRVVPTATRVIPASTVAAAPE